MDFFQCNQDFETPILDKPRQFVAINQTFDDKIVEKHNENPLEVRTTLKVPYSPKKIADNEVATFLNKGQKYEFQQHCISGHKRKGLLLKTILKLDFFDLDHNEKGLIYFDQWFQEHNFQNLLNIDFNENDVGTKISKFDLYGSIWEIIWRSDIVSLVYFSANFVGSDFEKRQGCEGAVMSLKCETLCIETECECTEISMPFNSCISCCRLKVFKFKGGDRKLKQDIEKFKRKDEELKNEIKKFESSYKKLEECQNALKNLHEQERIAILDAYVLREEELNDILRSAMDGFKSDKTFLKKEQDIVKNILNIDREAERKNIDSCETQLLNHVEQKNLELDLLSNVTKMNLELDKNKQTLFKDKWTTAKRAELNFTKTNFEGQLIEACANKNAELDLYEIKAEKVKEDDILDLKLYCIDAYDSIQNSMSDKLSKHERRISEKKRQFESNLLNIELVDWNKNIKTEEIKNQNIVKKNEIDSHKNITTSLSKIEQSGIANKKKCIESNRNINKEKYQLEKNTADIQFDEIVVKLDREKNMLEIYDKKMKIEIEEEKKLNEKLEIEQKITSNLLKNIELNELDKKIIETEVERKTKLLEADISTQLKMKKYENNKNCVNIDIEKEKLIKLKEIKEKILDVKNDNMIKQKKFETEKEISKQNAIQEKIMADTESIIRQQKAEEYNIICSKKAEEDQMAAETEKIIKLQRIETQKIIKTLKAEEEKITAEIEKDIELKKAETEKIIKTQKAEEEKMAAETEKIIKTQKAEEEKMAAETEKIIKTQKAEEEKMAAETERNIKTQKAETEKIIKNQKAEENKIIKLQKSEEEKMAAETELYLKQQQIESLKIVNHQKTLEEKNAAESDKVIKYKIVDERLFTDEICIGTKVKVANIDENFQINQYNLDEKKIKNEIDLKFQKTECDQAISETLARNEKIKRQYETNLMNDAKIKKVNSIKSLVEEEHNLQEKNIENTKILKNIQADHKLLEFDVNKSVTIKKINNQKHQVHLLNQEICNIIDKNIYNSEAVYSNKLLECDKKIHGNEIELTKKLNSLNEQKCKIEIDTSVKLHNTIQDHNQQHGKLMEKNNSIEKELNNTESDFQISKIISDNEKEGLKLLFEKSYKEIETENMIQKNLINLSKKYSDDYYKNVKNEIETEYQEKLNNIEIEDKIQSNIIQSDNQMNKIIFKKQTLNKKDVIESEKSSTLIFLNEQKLICEHNYRQLEQEHQKCYQNLENDNRNSFFDTQSEIQKLKSNNYETAIKLNQLLEKRYNTIYEEYKLKFQKPKQEFQQKLLHLIKDAERHKSSLSTSMKNFGENFIPPSNETVLHEAKTKNDKQSISAVYQCFPPCYESSLSDISYSNDLISSESSFKRNSPPPYSPNKILPSLECSVEKKTKISQMNDTEINNWLSSNRFEAAAVILKNFNGLELIKLTKDELKELLGISDAIRLRSLLDVSENLKNKIIFITLLNGNNEIIPDSQKAISLNVLSVIELINRTSDYVGFPKDLIDSIYTFNNYGQRIILIDELVATFEDFSSFILRIEKDNYFEEKIKLGFIPSHLFTGN